MNLQTRLDSRLWEVIENHYDNMDYTAAILDAIYFLSDLIREKSGLDGDGVQLIGQSFGGKAPRIKINRLETVTEKDAQTGLENMLRGFYQCIRNTRAHEKFSDNQADADEILLFVNHVVKIIDKSKSSFSLSSFSSRVFDEDFVESNRYAELLVREIPSKHKLNIFIEIFRHLTDGDGHKLKFFFLALWKSLERDEDKAEIARIVSEELRSTDESRVVRMIIQTIPVHCLEMIDEVARLRTENKLLKSIKEGRVVKGKCTKGGLGTWATSLIANSTMKEQFIDLLILKLLEGPEEVEYVASYFARWFPVWMEIPRIDLVQILLDGLALGDKQTWRIVQDFSINMQGRESWKKAFAKGLSSYVENKVVNSEEFESDFPF